MIQSFSCDETLRLFIKKTSRRWSNTLAVALRKLDELEAASALNDLRVSPGNRLAALAGGRQGQYSIRINDQWRICFVWQADGVHKVEIVDYH